jgi:hypothetical protein
MERLNKTRRPMQGGGPPYPYIKITTKQRDDAYENLKKYECGDKLTLSTTGNKVSNYYFQPYRERTKVGKWSHYSAWLDDEKRKKIIDIDKRIHRKNPKIIGTPAGLQSAMRMSLGSVNQFKPYIAVCGVYKKFKPKRILDTSAGWGDRLIGAMAMNIDYIGIDQNIKLITPYKRMIKDFENKTTSDIRMIFKKSQDVDYSKLPRYDLIFTSPPYFDLEKYEGMEIFKNKDEFIEKYWRPTIEKAYKYLEKGGHLALNMPEEMYIALKPMIGNADSKIKMPIQNRFNYKGDPPKFEYIYVWKKMSGGGGCKYKIKIDKIKLNDGRNINIFRDDLINGGTKIRLLDKIIPKIKNNIIVYAGPSSGYAQLALSIIGKKYNKKVVIFVPKRKIMSVPTLQAKNNGAIIKEVERPAYLNVVQSRAKEWSEKNKAYLMAFGLDEGYNIDILSNEIKKCLPANLNTKSKINIWLVVGSGLILRSLYKVFVNANFNVVQVGKKLEDYNKHNTVIYKSPYEFDKKETILPPYPSVDNYDAKVWRFVLKYAKNGDYVYNIAG